VEQHISDLEADILMGQYE